MAKSGEITYLELLGADGIVHAANKPFSDENCGQYLIALGTMRMLLPPPPARLLDLGCGTGWTSCLFGKMGYEVVGQDIAPDMIHHANLNRERYQVDNVSFVISDYEDMKFDGEFDGAVFFDCLHHATDESLALQKVAQALRPGGICITHEPGEGHADAEISVAAMEKFDVTEKDMPPWHIIELATRHGFRQSRVHPFPQQLVELFHEQSLQAADPRVRPTFRKRIGAYLRPLRIARALNANRLKRTGGLVVLTR